MTLLRSLFLIAAIAVTASASADVLSKVDAARTLISQGHAQSQAGKYNDALASYRAAAKADPAASEPLSYLALMMVYASQNTVAKNVDDYRAQARDYANAALKIDARDPNEGILSALLGAGGFGLVAAFIGTLVLLWKFPSLRS